MTTTTHTSIASSGASRATIDNTALPARSGAAATDSPAVTKASPASGYAYDLYALAPDGGSAVPAGQVAFARQALPGGSSAEAYSTGHPLANDGYAATYYQNETDTKGMPLYFSQGGLLSSLADANPSVSLQCADFPLAAITGASNAAGNAVPILLGNAQGQKVFGIDIQQIENLTGNQPVDLAEIPDDSASGEADEGLSTAWKWGLGAIGVTFLLIAVGVIYAKFIRPRRRLNQPEGPPEGTTVKNDEARYAIEE